MLFKSYSKKDIPILAHFQNIPRNLWKKGIYRLIYVRARNKRTLHPSSV